MINIWNKTDDLKKNQQRQNLGWYQWSFNQVPRDAHVCDICTSEDWYEVGFSSNGDGSPPQKGGFPNSACSVEDRRRSLSHFSQGSRDLVTGLKSRTNAGRPNWNKVWMSCRIILIWHSCNYVTSSYDALLKVFAKIREQKVGKVRIFCGKICQFCLYNTTNFNFCPHDCFSSIAETSEILVSREFSRIFFLFHFSFSISSRFNFTFTSRKGVKGFYHSLFTSRKKWKLSIFHSFFSRNKSEIRCGL